MKRIFTFLLVLMIFGSATASENKVVVSINPIHSLVASVMEGVGTPDLLIKGNNSLHGYQVKPSDANLLESADVIVWIGPTMESTLIASISNARESTTVIEVGEIHGLQLYENRESPEGGHMHHGEEDEHSHDEEDGHAEKDEHGHDEEHGHAEEDEHGHAHGRYDLHIWLDINNAKVVTQEIAEQLVDIYPQNEAQLISNMSDTLEKLDSLEVELRSLSESFSSSPFVVFHDAYQYLEKMLGLNNVGTITVSPEREAGAKRLHELREKISETGVSCVFKEPQFDPSEVDIISEGTDLQVGTLDPLGADIKPGPNAYFELLRNMVLSLKNCLG